ncbi:MAG: sugar phosphate isomerase/epimerase family protein [Dongiaceae bacterium]
MQVGIFTHYLPHSADETARRVRAYGFETVQLNLDFPDWRFAPLETSAADCSRLRDTFARHGISVAAIAGYVNPVATDADRRQANAEWLNAVLRRALDLGSPYVVTETGSYHPDDDWAPHPQNATPAAYDDLCGVMKAASRIAEESGAVLLLEPSVGNVIDTPEKARRLLEDVDSPALGLVADPANYIDGGNIAQADAVLQHLFDVIGDHIHLAHAKDVHRFNGVARERHHHPTDPALYGGVEYPSAGLGQLNYELYVRLLARRCPDVALIVEHLNEADIPRAKSFVDTRLAALNA